MRIFICKDNIGMHTFFLHPLPFSLFLYLCVSICSLWLISSRCSYEISQRDTKNLFYITEHVHHPLAYFITRDFASWCVQYAEEALIQARAHPTLAASLPSHLFASAFIYSSGGLWAYPPIIRDRADIGVNLDTHDGDALMEHYDIWGV